METLNRSQRIVHANAKPGHHIGKWTRKCIMIGMVWAVSALALSMMSQSGHSTRLCMSKSSSMAPAVASSMLVCAFGTDSKQEQKDERQGPLEEQNGQDRVSTHAHTHAHEQQQQQQQQLSPKESTTYSVKVNINDMDEDQDTRRTRELLRWLDQERKKQKRLQQQHEHLEQQQKIYGEELLNAKQELLRRQQDVASQTAGQRTTDSNDPLDDAEDFIGTKYYDQAKGGQTSSQTSTSDGSSPTQSDSFLLSFGNLFADPVTQKTMIQAKEKSDLVVQIEDADGVVKLRLSFYSETLNPNSFADVLMPLSTLMQYSPMRHQLFISFRIQSTQTLMARFALANIVPFESLMPGGAINFILDKLKEGMVGDVGTANTAPFDISANQEPWREMIALENNDDELLELMQFQDNILLEGEQLQQRQNAGTPSKEELVKAAMEHHAAHEQVPNENIAAQQVDGLGDIAHNLNSQQDQQISAHQQQPRSQPQSEPQSEPQSQPQDPLPDITMSSEELIKDQDARSIQSSSPPKADDPSVDDAVEKDPIQWDDRDPLEDQILSDISELSSELQNNQHMVEGPEVDISSLHTFSSPETSTEDEVSLLREEYAEQILEKAKESMFHDSSVNRALSLFAEAADLGNAEAMATLASIYLSGVPDVVPRDIAKAYEYAKRGGDLGHPDALYTLGFLYMRSPYTDPTMRARAILYWTLSLNGGNYLAQMSMAFRFVNGIDVEKACDAAALLYERTATTVLGLDQEEDSEERQHAAEILEQRLVERAIRLRDEDLYSNRRATKVNRNSPWRRSILRSQKAQQLKNGQDTSNRLESSAFQTAEQNEIINYYKHSAAGGDVQAQVALGQVHYFGLQGIPQDLNVARLFYERAARAGSPMAHTSLAYMYMKGMGGLPMSNHSAAYHFKVAADKGDPAGLNGLGYCYLNGIGVEADAAKALAYFQRAADKGYDEALYNLGVMHLDGLGTPRNPKKALQHFLQASQHGHIYAMYQAGVILRHGFSTFAPGPNAPTSASTDVASDCPRAVRLLKYVSEQGDLMEILFAAEDAFWNEEYHIALYRYLQAADAGSEVGQYNAAFLMHHGLAQIGDDYWRAEMSSTRSLQIAGHEVAEDPNVHSSDNKTNNNNTMTLSRNEWNTKHEAMDHALAFYRLSGLQGFAKSLNVVGDIEYSLERYEEAVDAYRQASNANFEEAMFNLGVMYMFGVGIAMDDNLAKRYFDLAIKAHPDAYIPSSLALVALSVPSASRRQFFELYRSNGPRGLAKLCLDFVWGHGDLMVLVVLIMVLGYLYVENNRRRRRAEAAVATEPGVLAGDAAIAQNAG